MNIDAEIKPSPNGFGLDPFGYSALAWYKWSLVQALAGFETNPEKGPSAEDLKSPVLWLTHAHALSEAAVALVRNPPNLAPIPTELQGACHCQYHAVALMLVGYSLEVVLKAMVIMTKGVKAYSEEERQYRHHNLEKLAEFIPNLSLKDKATLRCLTHFSSWAGRYPDPGFGRLAHAGEIFEISEANEISAKELFELATRVMRHAQVVAHRPPE